MYKDTVTWIAEQFACDLVHINRESGLNVTREHALNRDRIRTNIRIQMELDIMDLWNITEPSVKSLTDLSIETRR